MLLRSISPRTDVRDSGDSEIKKTQDLFSTTVLPTSCRHLERVNSSSPKSGDTNTEGKMKYVSTRDTASTKTLYTLREALLLGYAPNDGGLFVPYIDRDDVDFAADTVGVDSGEKNLSSNINELNAQLLERWSKLTFQELTVEVLWVFCRDEFPSRDDLLREVIEPALSGFVIPPTSTTAASAASSIPAAQRSSTSLPLPPTYNCDHDSDTVRVVRLLEVSNAGQSESRQQPNLSSTPSSVSSSSPPPLRVYVSELFWGPTFCFKDLGMRVTIGLLDYFARREDLDSVTLVVSTTGDTGPACVQAVSDLSTRSQESRKTVESQSEPRHSSPSSKLGLIVHYPKGQISELQRRQLTTADIKSKIRIVCFDGGGDDMDIPIKNIMTKNESNKTTASDMILHSSNSLLSDSSTLLQDRHVVCGVNSYNVGRPLMQMVHFVWTYLRVVEKEQQQQILKGNEHSSDHDSQNNQQSPWPLLKLDVVIPTGAMGNAVGCYMAKKILGLPINKIICACNANDTTYQVMEATGHIQRPPTGCAMKKTLSDAINIQFPYNLERLLFYLTGCNHQLIHDWYSTIESNDTITTGMTASNGKVDLNQPMTTSDENTPNPKNWFVELQNDFRSVRVTDDDLCGTMRYVRDRYQYISDPHTGVAFHAARQLGYLHHEEALAVSSLEPNIAVTIIATASPCKFEEAVTTAMGKETWDKYYMSDQFPSSGKELFVKPETEPIDYRYDHTKSFEENQVDWESKTRVLIKELQQIEQLLPTGKKSTSQTGESL